MRELDPIKITWTALAPNCECTRNIEQPHADNVLLSHFEVAALSPQGSSTQLTDLRIDQLCYLFTPAPLMLLKREQQCARERAERQMRQRLQPLLGLLDPQHVRSLIKPDRRAARLIALDIRWNPQQRLAMTLKNLGTVVVDEVSIELVLYSLDGPLPIAN